jgi:hypothetical protein
MPSHRPTPPWEFLLSASRNSLQSYELSRLGHVANLRKEVVALLDQMIEENSAAMLARWLMEHREREAAAPDTPTPAVCRVAPAQSASDNFLPDFAAERSPHNGRI